MQLKGMFHYSFPASLQTPPPFFNTHFEVLSLYFNNPPGICQTLGSSSNGYRWHYICAFSGWVVLLMTCNIEKSVDCPFYINNISKRCKSFNSYGKTLKIYSRRSVRRLHQNILEKAVKRRLITAAPQIKIILLSVLYGHMQQCRFQTWRRSSQLANNDDTIQGHTNNSLALERSYFKFPALFCGFDSGRKQQRESPFWWCNATFCLNPLTGLRETINESVLFSGGSVLVKVSVMKLLFFLSWPCWSLHHPSKLIFKSP